MSLKPAYLVSIVRLLDYKGLYYHNLRTKIQTISVRLDRGLDYTRAGLDKFYDI